MESYVIDHTIVESYLLQQVLRMLCVLVISTTIFFVQY